MGIRIERVGNLAVTVTEYKGEKFYSLEDILEQTEKKNCIFITSSPIELNCRIIYSHRVDGNHFIYSVFVDEKGLKSLCEKED